jgi:hypothetical protein
MGYPFRAGWEYVYSAEQRGVGIDLHRGGFWSAQPEVPASSAWKTTAGRSRLGTPNHQHSGENDWEDAYGLKFRSWCTILLRATRVAGDRRKRD